MTKTEELLKLAEAATQSEWAAVENPHLAFGGVQLYWIDSEAGNLAENICEEEAMFIAAANPATIIELIALVRQMREVIGKCMDYQDACTCDGYAEHTTHIPSGKSMDWTQMRKALASFDRWECGE